MPSGPIDSMLDGVMWYCGNTVVLAACYTLLYLPTFLKSKACDYHLHISEDVLTISGEISKDVPMTSEHCGRASKMF